MKNLELEQLTNFSTQDFISIKHLATQIGKRYTPLTETEFKDMLASKQTHIIVAREPKSNTIVGMVLINSYRIPYVKKAYLDDLIVDKAYRGQKIGSQLVEQALDLAKKLGAAYIELTSNPQRLASHKLYEKYGFSKRETTVYRVTYDEQ
jgi:ribosomal protein S18 acetylase RimI-like enzyme